MPGSIDVVRVLSPVLPLLAAYLVMVCVVLALPRRLRHGLGVAAFLVSAATLLQAVSVIRDLATTARPDLAAVLRVNPPSSEPDLSLALDAISAALSLLR